MTFADTNQHENWSGWLINTFPDIDVWVTYNGEDGFRTLGFKGERLETGFIVSYVNSRLP